MLLEYSLREQRIFLFNEFDMTKVTALWVLRLLALDQKRNRLIISWKNLALLEVDPAIFLERFLTQDTFQVDHFDPDTKWQFMQFETPLLTYSKERQ